MVRFITFVTFTDFHTLFSFAVDDCLSEIHITGQSVIESGTQDGVELICSFQFSSSEYKQLDIKWYFATEEEPFLQWVPSSGREPQTVGQMFKSRVTTRHTLNNTTNGYKTEQVIHVLRPSIHMSGHYLGPFLSYSSLPDHLNLSCSASQVFPEPELSITW